MSRESFRIPSGTPEDRPRSQRAARSSEDAVRAELRAALHDLADSLLSQAPRAQLLDAIRHAWVLADLGDVEEGLLRKLLRSLQRELMAQLPVNGSHYANQLTFLATKL
jgi:hypothetical protein